MREIKFRLIKDNKIVGYEKHKLYIEPHTDKHNVCIYHSRTQHEMSWYEITLCPKEYLPHDNKNQFTGLRDANGKEIYEGDILLTDPESKKAKALVVWDDSHSQWAYTYNQLSNHSIRQEILDIINAVILGNVWENPKLLEEK